MEGLQSGGTGACKGKRILALLNRRLFAPETDRCHYFILWRSHGFRDWVIFESIGKGVAVSLLSYYKGEDVGFYRVNCYLRPLNRQRWKE